MNLMAKEALTGEEARKALLEEKALMKEMERKKAEARRPSRRERDASFERIRRLSETGETQHPIKRGSKGAVQEEQMMIEQDLRTIDQPPQPTPFGQYGTPEGVPCKC